MTETKQNEIISEIQLAQCFPTNTGL